MDGSTPTGAKPVTSDQQGAEPAQPAARGVPLGVRALVAVGIVLLVLGVAAWVFLGGDDGDETVDQGPRPAVAARVVTVDELRELAAREGPAYWVGQRVGVRYEFSRTADDRVFVRYLSPGMTAGGGGTEQLTVATYRVEDAFAATRRVGEAEGAVTQSLRGGGLAVYDPSAPTSAYVAYPDSDRQIEVFHPLPERARRLAFAGAVVPILPQRGSTPEERGEPVEASLARLERLAAEIDHPVYWLGPMRGRKYELTRLPNGEIYIRYLPENVLIGDYRAQWVTIGTFPVDDARAAIEAEAARIGAVTFDLPGGGLGYYHETTPTNVHFAFPGSDFQIEVFHPRPGRAQELARSGRLLPIG